MINSNFFSIRLEAMIIVTLMKVRFMQNFTVIRTYRNMLVKIKDTLISSEKLDVTHTNLPESTNVFDLYGKVLS